MLKSNTKSDYKACCIQEEWLRNTFSYKRPQSPAETSKTKAKKKKKKQKVNAGNFQNMVKTAGT